MEWGESVNAISGNQGRPAGTRIERCFADLQASNQKGFIAYITAGDPSLADTADLVLRLEDAGADIVELGIPFSDPLADGRVNQMSAARALAAGTTPRGVLQCVAAIRRRSQVPILLYAYLNLMLAGGFERNMRAAAAAGVDGLLLLDLPVEEAAEYAVILRRHNLNNTCLVTPTSPLARIRRIVASSTGFVYCVSREGVTGMQRQLAPAALRLVARTKSCTRLPVALGFRIATPAAATAAATAADAVVVGSAIVDRFHRAGRTGRAAAARWVGGLIRAVKRV